MSRCKQLTEKTGSALLSVGKAALSTCSYVAGGVAAVCQILRICMDENYAKECEYTLRAKAAYEQSKREKRKPPQATSSHFVAAPVEAIIPQPVYVPPPPRAPERLLGAVINPNYISAPPVKAAGNSYTERLRSQRTGHHYR